jgi:hypothetical protein
LHNNTTLIPPTVSVSAEANKLDMVDAAAAVERPLGVELNQRRAEALPAEGEITLTPFGNDNSDEVPAIGMR